LLTLGWYGVVALNVETVRADGHSAAVRHCGGRAVKGAVVSAVETLSVEQARRRRAEVLASVGGDECDLRDCAAR
jgi:hypothetical protein